MAEISLQRSSLECAVMWSITDRTSQRRRPPVSLQQQALEHCAYFDPRPHGVAARKARPWIPSLTSECDKPDGWSGTDSTWDKRFRARCEDYFARAAKWLAQPNRDRLCPRADDFGGTPGDGMHADDQAPCPEAKRVRCMRGEMQAYWDLSGCWKAKVKR